MKHQNYVLSSNGTQDGTQDDTQNVPQDVLQDVPQGVPQDSLNSQIISMIKDNNKISTETMASVLETSSKTMKRRIKSMPNIHYVGRGYSGHWEIDE